ATSPTPCAPVLKVPACSTCLALHDLSTGRPARALQARSLTRFCASLCMADCGLIPAGDYPAPRASPAGGGASYGVALAVLRQQLTRVNRSSWGRRERKRRTGTYSRRCL